MAAQASARCLNGFKPKFNIVRKQFVRVIVREIFSLLRGQELAPDLAVSRFVSDYAESSFPEYITILTPAEAVQIGVYTKILVGQVAPGAFRLVVAFDQMTVPINIVSADYSGVNARYGYQKPVLFEIILNFS